MNESINPENYEVGDWYAEGNDGVLLSTSDGHPCSSWHIGYNVTGFKQSDGNGYKKILAITRDGDCYIKTQKWNTWTSWKKICTTDDTDIHITSAERDKWNEVDNKIDKTDITTTIDSSSTDTQVPSAKAVYYKTKNRVIRIEKGGDIIAYADSLGNEAVTETIRITNSKNSPYGANDEDNDFHYTIYNMYDARFKRIVAYDIRKNDMYMIMKYGGKWRTWQRLCATSVADVPKTNIAPADEARFIGFKGNSMCNYCVVNGVCYVSIWNVQINVTGRAVTGVILPKPKTGFFGGVCLIGGGDANTHAYAHIIPETGELKFNVKDANTPLYGAFSYPVAE